MKKIHGIVITTDTMVSGMPVEKGDELFVPEDISQDDAAVLLGMNNRATEIKPEADDVEEQEADGANVPNSEPAINASQLLSILDKKAADIAEAIRARNDDEPIVTDENLARLYKAEEDGNTRKNVVAVFETEIKARGLNKDDLFSTVFGE